tara:strand:- start:7897 stop:8136 length:240 start_codon:yes stop_codon:yes gene_type:complete
MQVEYFRSPADLSVLLVVHQMIGGGGFMLGETFLICFVSIFRLVLTLARRMISAMSSVGAVPKIGLLKPFLINRRRNLV